MKSLVVYFSHTGENLVNDKVVYLTKGNTKVIAEKISALTGADLFEIEPVIEYPIQFEACNAKAKEESENNIHPQIKNLMESIEQYDKIFLGFPIWYRSYPRIIATFLESFDFSGKIIKPFCTNDEGSFGIAELELRTMVKNSKLKNGYAISGGKVTEEDPLLAQWVEY